ncbi:MAG: type II CAAX endopeptidase family protein [Clostridiales bacterium]|nr:type II CAAX endopeptidase family protein [Clostridiales bacterium]
MPPVHQPLGSDSTAPDRKLLQNIRYLVVTVILALLLGTVLYQLARALFFRFNQAIQQLTSIPLLPTLTQLSSGLVSIVGFGVPLLALYLMLKNTFSFRSLIHRSNEAELLHAIAIALGVLAIGTLLTDISSDFLGLFQIKLLKSDILIPDGFLPLLLFLCNYILITPILEELLFRGIILQLFRRFGDLFALVISTLFYVMTEETYTSFIPTFLFGIVAGYFVLHSRSIFTGMLMHTFYNLVIVILSIFTSALEPNAAMTTQITLFLILIAAFVVAVIRFLCKGKEPFSIAENAAGSTLTLSARFKAALCNPAFILFALVFLYRLLQLVQIL